MEVRDPSLYNEDLAPIPPARRSWGTYNYASLWVAMSVCIPTYMLASGLIAGGMSWWQAIATILLGNLIVLTVDVQLEQLTRIEIARSRIGSLAHKRSSVTQMSAGSLREGKL